MERTARPDVPTSLLEPDLERVARLIGGAEAEIVAAELLSAQRSRGETYRTGEVCHPVSREWIELSNEELDRYPGATWLVRKRVRDVPRALGAEIPVELFPPPVLRSPRVTSLVGIAADLCSWVTVPAWTTDPLKEFESPVPVSDQLDTISVLGLSSMTYAGLAAARRNDVSLIAAVETVRGALFYRTRALLRWLRKGRRGRA